MRFAAGGRRGCIDLIDDHRRDAWSLSSSVSRRRRVLRRRAVRPIRSRADATRSPARQARIPRATARCVLPVPAGPAARRSPCRPGSRAGRGAAPSRVERGLEGEVELLDRLARREPRGLDPAWPPWLSRLSTRSSAASRRTAHSSTLLAGTVGELRHALAAAGALSARNRCASSVAGRLMRSARRSGQAIGSRPWARDPAIAAPRSARACSRSVIVRCLAKHRWGGTQPRRCQARPRGPLAR